MDDRKDPQEEFEKGNDRRLNSFVAELIHIQDDKLVGKEDLAKLLDKYQLSVEDTSKLQMLIDRHLTRAAEYSRRERWDNAIVETERALLFSPLDNEIRLELAELFLQRSTKYGYLQKDLNRAEHEIQDALTLEPENTEARKFQKELKDLKKMLQGKQNNRKFIPLLIALFLILGIALFPQMRKRFQFLSLRNQEEQISSNPAVPVWETKKVEIITSDAFAEEFDLTLKETTVIRTAVSGTPALRISGYLQPIKDDYSQLELSLMPDTGTSEGITVSLVSPEDAPLRRGETESFSRFIYLKDSPETYESLYVSIGTSRKYYEEGSVQWERIDYFRTAPLPQGVFIDLEGQLHSLLEGYDRYYLFYDIRLSSRGMEGLRALDLNCLWTDESGQAAAGRTLSLVDDPAVPVPPRSVQTTRIMFDLPKRSGIEGGRLDVTLERAEKE